MRKTFKGWVGKMVMNNGIQKHWREKGYCISMFKRKGKKAEWESKDWPPLKVTITVEMED
jgi:hypothetical protein